jgi:hypothetical protein
MKKTSRSEAATKKAVKKVDNSRKRVARRLVRWLFPLKREGPTPRELIACSQEHHWLRSVALRR